MVLPFSYISSLSLFNFVTQTKNWRHDSTNHLSAEFTITIFGPWTVSLSNYLQFFYLTNTTCNLSSFFWVGLCAEWLGHLGLLDLFNCFVYDSILTWRRVSMVEKLDLIWLKLLRFGQFKIKLQVSRGLCLAVASLLN